MTPNGSEEPSAEARKAARACRDMFVGLVAEGFSEQQALVIIGNMIRSANGGGT